MGRDGFLNGGQILVGQALEQSAAERLQLPQLAAQDGAPLDDDGHSEDRAEEKPVDDPVAPR